MEKEDDKKEDKKEDDKKEDKKEDKEDKKENENDKKYKKNKIKNYLQNIDNNHKQDSATFLENLKMFDKKFNKKEEKVPNISNRFPGNLNQMRNNEGTEDDFAMNVNETLIDPYPNLDTNPFRQNGDYLNLAQNQEQINLLRIIADNLSRENQRGISHSVIFIGYIICFLILTNRFANNGGFDYSASRSLYYMIVALSCFISVIYLKEIVKANKKNKNK